MERRHLPYKPGMLGRDHIIDLLMTGLDYPLITLVAGPGYGKTQAAAQFVRSLPHRVNWINLTPLDNSSRHFWHKSVSALQHEFPELASILLERGFPNERHEFDRYLELLAKELTSGPESVLVLDNFGVLTEGPVRTFLEALISVQFAKLCILLISTNMNDQERARNLVGHDCLEITSDMFRFTRDEAELLFHSTGIDSGRVDLDSILKETQGWPLAVYLVCQLFANGEEANLPRGTSIRLPELDRLFESGFYSKYPPQFQHMLVCFSFLPSFSLDMVREMHAGRDATFYEFILKNVFISYDYYGQTYTFHPMYQGFLQQNRHAVTDAEMERVHKIAGDWFFAHGSYFEAVACYFHCPCYVEMSEAIRMLLLSRADDIPAAYLLSYLQALPEAFLKEHPEIRFSIALLYVSQLELRKAKALLMEIERELAADALDEDRARLLGETYAMLANIAVMRSDAACFAYYPKAAALLRDGSHHHSKALMSVGNNNLLFLPGSDAGLLKETVASMVASAEYTVRYMRGQAYGFEYLFAAEAAYAVCDTASMHENCHRAIFRAMKEDQHDIICNAYFLQLRGDVFEGDYEGVQQRLLDLQEYCEKHTIDKLVEIYDNARGWLYLRLGLLDRMPSWIAEYDENRYMQLPYTIGRNKIGHACYLAAKHRYRECIAYLDELEGIYEESALWTIHLHHYIIKAICLVEIGADREAVSCLHRAYELTHQNDIIMCFAEYSGWLDPLLDLAEGQKELRFSPRWLKKVREKAWVFGKGIAAIKREQGKETVEPSFSVRLSRREREVLCFLVNGSTRNEIARELGISVNSVKTHIGGAYSKLGAANRADAIRLAISMGIQSM